MPLLRRLAIHAKLTYRRFQLPKHHEKIPLSLYIGQLYNDLSLTGPRNFNSNVLDAASAEYAPEELQPEINRIAGELIRYTVDRITSVHITSGKHNLLSLQKQHFNETSELIKVLCYDARCAYDNHEELQIGQFTVRKPI